MYPNKQIRQAGHGDWTHRDPDEEARDFHANRLIATPVHNYTARVALWQAVRVICLLMGAGMDFHTCTFLFVHNDGEEFM